MAQISIIVPVYNVEQYLERCVTSLRNQTLTDIEIILVDDGSPDQSGAMCDCFAKLDNRIRVIHKKNGGLSSARNAGLRIATGEYIGFLDSDDDISCDMYETMVAVAKRYSVDFVMSDYKRIFADGTERLVHKEIRKGFYDKQQLKTEIFPNLIMSEQIDYGPILSVCNCIYKKEFLLQHNIVFADDVKWSEDNLFSAMVGYRANSFYYMKGESFYRYHQNPGTITTSYRKGAWEVYKRMNVYLQEYFAQEKNYDFSRQIQLHLLYYACNVLGMESQYATGFFERTKKFSKILQDELLVKTLKSCSVPNAPIKLQFQIYCMKLRLSLLLAIIYSRRAMRANC